MISGLFILSVLLATVCLRRKRALQRRRAEGRMAFGLDSCSFEFFAVLAAAKTHHAAEN